LRIAVKKHTIMFLRGDTPSAYTLTGIFSTINVSTIPHMGFYHEVLPLFFSSDTFLCETKVVFLHLLGLPMSRFNPGMTYIRSALDAPHMWSSKR
jgi:hypothetical protein